MTDRTAFIRQIAFILQNLPNDLDSGYTKGAATRKLKRLRKEAELKNYAFYDILVQQLDDLYATHGLSAFSYYKILNYLAKALLDDDNPERKILIDYKMKADAEA